MTRTTSSSTAEGRDDPPTSASTIGVIKEAQPGETRVAATPATVAQLSKLGYEVVIESGAGVLSSFADEAYVEAGATIGNALKADIVFGVNAPPSSSSTG